MTLCSNCQAKIPTLQTRVKRVNNALHNLGLSYHEARFRVLDSINSILEDNGFRVLNWNIVSDRMESEIGEDKWIAISFYRMESGRWEVVAYIN
jgi:hypothetical protein